MVWNAIGKIVLARSSAAVQVREEILWLKSEIMNYLGGNRENIGRTTGRGRRDVCISPHERP
jgi:hypothetical protein